MAETGPKRGQGETVQEIARLVGELGPENALRVLEKAALAVRKAEPSRRGRRKCPVYGASLDAVADIMVREPGRPLGKAILEVAKRGLPGRKQTTQKVIKATLNRRWKREESILLHEARTRLAQRGEAGRLPRRGISVSELLRRCKAMQATQQTEPDERGVAELADRIMAASAVYAIGPVDYVARDRAMSRARSILHNALHLGPALAIAYANAVGDGLPGFSFRIRITSEELDRLARSGPRRENGRQDSAA